MRLWLTEAQVATIVQHAQADSPREVCGIIVGNSEQAQRVIAMTNVASDPLHFYQLDNEALEREVRQVRADDLSLIGIYHSHPRGEPIPSPTDVAQAPPLAAAHLLVGLRHQQPRLAAWAIQNHQVERVDLHIGNEPPNWEDDAPLSKAQKTAIIISAIIAFMLVLIISLSLLPPAPIIVTATPTLP
jgi:proteasome lid subunit RPN8/RPN11